MVRLGALLIASLTAFCTMHAEKQGGEWTWIYKKMFNDHVRNANSSKKTVIFADDTIKPFTQLIFSWNALRPAKGYFSFSAQVRDAQTKKWGEWHMMVDWGNGVQRSYMSKGNGFSSYAHVRLEIENKRSADGFRIRVEPRGGAHLGLLYGLSAATTHFELFKPEIVDDIVKQMKTFTISGVPKIAQLALGHEDNSRICSPVSCTMAVNYMMNIRQDPLQFAAGVFDEGLKIYGSWGCNAAHAFDVCGGLVYFWVKRCNSFLDIYHQLLRGIPSVVSVRGALPGALKAFPHGHLLVVIGCDAKTHEVICHDPAAENHGDVTKRYSLEHFLQAWERSHRLTYAIDPHHSFQLAKNLN